MLLRSCIRHWCVSLLVYMGGLEKIVDEISGTSSRRIDNIKCFILEMWLECLFLVEWKRFLKFVFNINQIQKDSPPKQLLLM